ncbi:Periplasmic pH-dependent serine endoprotease DegQ precursor [compost metagenome]
MRRYLVAFLAFLIFAAGWMAYPAVAGPSKPNTPLASYSVKVIKANDMGHGSGTHIGGGYILTAAHVVEDDKSMKIKTNNGLLRYAKVLWVNKDYDVALLRTSEQGMKSAHLSCRALKEGALIRADGNPLNIEFVSSSGKISGSARDFGKPRSAYVTDMTTVMGMSGGGIFDRNGDMVGIVSAVAVAPMKVGAGYVPSLTGFGMAIPSFEVCALMGRSE